MKRIISLSLISLFLTFPVYGQDVVEPNSGTPDVTQTSDPPLENADPLPDLTLDSNVNLLEEPSVPEDLPAPEDQPAQGDQPDSDFLSASEDQPAAESESNADQDNAPLLETPAQLAEKDLKEGGYRLLMNMGKAAGQEVPHLHTHLFAGKKLGKMLP